jgi:hypothetical protein
VWHSTWHVGNAVENAVVNLEGWFGVSGWMTIRKTSTLINSDVN